MYCVYTCVCTVCMYCVCVCVCTCVCMYCIPPFLIIVKNQFFSLCDPINISGFLSSGSHHSWVNLKSSECESTTDIFLAFPFAQIAK